MDEKARLVEKLKAAIDDVDLLRLEAAYNQFVQYVKGKQVHQADAFIDSLQASVDAYDHNQTAELCATLRTHLQQASSTYPTDKAQEILDTLRRKSLFVELGHTADVFIQSGCSAPTIVRMYAQALIEQGQLFASIRVLEQLEKQCIELGERKELCEARGLLGRAHKQIYIDGAETGTPGPTIEASLRISFNYYLKEYEHDKSNLWHGVNALAVWHRAQKDGVKLPEFGAESAAHAMLEHVNEKIVTNTSESELDMWTQVSAAEINIALEDYEQALKWIGLYVDEKHIKANNSDAFEVGSTLRQLEQVWQFDCGDFQQSRILQVLRSELLLRQGGSVSVRDLTAESDVIDHMAGNSEFEAILGKERFKNLRWLQTGLDRARCVCKFVDQFDDGFGTGFLLKAEELNLPHPNQWVILTNAHVISSDATEQNGNPQSVPPEKARVCFEAAEESERLYTIDQILAWSPRAELDFCVLTLKEPMDLAHNPMPMAKKLPLKDKDQRIYVIGHPRGGKISFSLYDNLLLDHDIPKIHYRSPTQGGSSGSPVFNQNWDLIGLHHAGGTRVKKLNGKVGVYPANEGIWIQSIASMIAAKRAN